MFTVLAVLAFVIVLVLGVALVEAFDPMPKAQAWGKAVYVAAVVVAPPVVPVVVQARFGSAGDRDDCYTYYSWLAEQEKEARRAVEAYWSELEAERREQHADWVAYRTWLQQEKLRAAKLGNAAEQARWAQYITGEYNRSCSRIDWPDQADLLADDYQTREAGRTRRAKAQHTKWTQQPDNSKPALVKLNDQHIDRVWDWGTQTWQKTVEIKQEVFVYQRTLVPAGRSHHTKHVNPRKGQLRMSERMGELDSAFGDVWENEFDS